MFDPDAFGEEMGVLIRDAVAPLHAEIASLKAQVAALPAPVAGKDGEPGKDADIETVKALVAEAVKAIPVINGKDGADGVGIKSSSLWQRKDGGVGVNLDLTDGTKIEFDVPKGNDGADGIGLAGAMIDRDGALQISLTNGEVKSLGVIVGKDGKDGTNGSDGIGFDSFDLEYIEQTHEVCVKASCAGRTKELRYPAGGIRPAGYWREGAKAKAGDAWVHDGSLWIATKATSAKPATGDDWIIAARKGRDGERGQKGADAIPPAPVKLKA